MTTVVAFPGRPLRKELGKLDRFAVWYFENLWLARVTITIPIATLISLLQFELMARMMRAWLP